MTLTEEELKLEKKYLKSTIDVIRNNLSGLGQELYTQEEKVKEFQKFMWDNKNQLDPQEMRSLMSDNDIEIFFMQQKGKYFKKLFKIQNNPYFGSIIFKEDNLPLQTIYIGITHLKDQKDNYLINDWRSPICSLFYDYENGPCFYKAPGGVVSGELLRKRQYKIQNGNLIHIFDNSINIDDDLLQEVLSNDSSEKMKNIVNTIQQEQNLIIRNTEDKNLIVQGIAGSGKTSVALHRIAFLLYKLENLSSSNVLIFSPNNVFSEYISNVLPELGEDNTNESTFHDFLSSSITEYKNIESFTNFVSRYYTNNEKNPELVQYKQSDEVINDIDNYVNDIVNSTKFINGIEDDIYYHYNKYELNNMLQSRYDKFPLFERINEMSIKISEVNFDGKHAKVKSIKKKLMDNLNIKKDYKEIYSNFFKSDYCKIKLAENEIKSFVNKQNINYEDGILFVYLKSLLEGFDYNNIIKEVVIDEAQDYTKLQYILLSKIFKTSGFTILGDINQTINPYYKYNSLTKICDILSGSTKYLELVKTYRSSEEIINYTNKILGLNYVTAIRKNNNKPVLFRKNANIKDLINDIKRLQMEYKSIAIITKDDDIAMSTYNLLKETIDLGIITSKEEIYRRDLIVLPAFMAKGLEFDSVIIYNSKDNFYFEKEKYLYYVACTRAQHELIIYN